MVCPADSVGKKGNKSCKPHLAVLPTQWGLGQRAEHQHWDFSQTCSCQKPPMPNDSYLKEEKSKYWMGNLDWVRAWLVDLSLKTCIYPFFAPYTSLQHWRFHWSLWMGTVISFEEYYMPCPHANKVSQFITSHIIHPKWNDTTFYYDFSPSFEI